MMKPRILGHALSTLAMTWAMTLIVSGAAASAQLPLLLDEILLSEYGTRDTAPAETVVAVDESGRWLTLRTATDGYARRNTGMAELLEFDAADTLGTFETSAGLSAEDYRYPSMASPREWVWVYDADPLDRGVHKRELGGSKGTRGRSRIVRSRFTASADRSTSRTEARNSAARSGAGHVIEILIRTPRLVMNTVKSVYRSENAPIFGIGLVAFIIGLATFMDLMGSSRRV